MLALIQFAAGMFPMHGAGFRVQRRLHMAAQVHLLTLRTAYVFDFWGTFHFFHDTFLSGTMCFRTN